MDASLRGRKEREGLSLFSVQGKEKRAELDGVERVNCTFGGRKGRGRFSGKKGGKGRGKRRCLKKQGKREKKLIILRIELVEFVTEKGTSSFLQKGKGKWEEAHLPREKKEWG